MTSIVYKDPIGNYMYGVIDDEGLVFLEGKPVRHYETLYTGDRATARKLWRALRALKAEYDAKVNEVTRQRLLAEKNLVDTTISRP